MHMQPGWKPPGHTHPASHAAWVPTHIGAVFAAGGTTKANTRSATLASVLPVRNPITNNCTRKKEITHPREARA
jgi:hypothetical protein